MKLRFLGQSPIQVSTLAYGGWRLAGSEGSPPPTSSSPGKRAILAAVDAGYTFFDFADIYGGGRCEAIFGEALHESPGLRERLVIATKCGIRRPGDPSPGTPYRYDFSANHLVASVEGSLRRLGIETVDLLMLHRPDYLMNPSEVAGVFAALRDAGKVREFGVSNFRPSQLTVLQQACPFPLVVQQVEISLLHLAAFEDGTLDQCLTNNVVPMAWSPLSRGALFQGAADEISDPERARRFAVRRMLDELAQVHETTPGAVALAWLLQHPAGIIPIVGSNNPGRIVELAKAEAVGLSRENWYRLMEAAQGGRLP